MLYNIASVLVNWGLRDYGESDQLGLEETPELYVENMVQVFREVKRILKPYGTLWLNLGDSYSGSNSTKDAAINENTLSYKSGQKKGGVNTARGVVKGLKPKDLCGIPWRVAFALQADGWWLRQDIIWCLSGGTWLYVKSQKGVMPMMVKDLYRLDPSTIKLWNGDKWTQLLGMNKNHRKGDEIELTLRSGERISCTPTHKFPTEKGLLEAKDIKIGDCLKSSRLANEGETPSYIKPILAWFIGLYLAEGSKSHNCLQIAGHVKETSRWYDILELCKYYGCTATRTIDGNKMDIRVYGKLLRTVIEDHINGSNAKNKGLDVKCWGYSNIFLQSLLMGYLDGDGHKDKQNNRWRLGFTRNYNLERDLRIICARLGYNLTLNKSISKIGDKQYPSFRGEIRFDISSHCNNKDRNEVVSIKKARCRYVYDLGVEDEPNLFSLASGILTHNSKPNPMPESVQDRCTKSHEYIFLLSKSAKYYYDHEAIAEPANYDGRKDSEHKGGKKYKNINEMGNNKHERWKLDENGVHIRNKRSVWTVPTKPFKGAHFAVFPPELIKPCILAGSAEKDVVIDPFAGSGTTLAVARKYGRQYLGIELNPEYIKLAEKRIKKEKNLYEEL